MRADLHGMQTYHITWHSFFFLFFSSLRNAHNKSVLMFRFLTTASHFLRQHPRVVHLRVVHQARFFARLLEASIDLFRKALPVPALAAIKAIAPLLGGANSFYVNGQNRVSQPIFEVKTTPTILRNIIYIVAGQLGQSTGYTPTRPDKHKNAHLFITLLSGQNFALNRVG